MRTILLDTSALYALADRRDPDHVRVATCVMSLADAAQLLVTNYVFSEALTLIKARLGTPIAISVGENLRSGSMCRLMLLAAADDEAAWQIFQRSRDKAWSYTDCSCLAVMRRLGIEEALATDVHFRQMGVTVLP